MKFLLFSKIFFEVPDPFALIESYCFQNHFYEHYDLANYEGERKVENVKYIGARIEKNLLGKCNDVINSTKALSIFKYDKYGLDRFLKLDDISITVQVKELNEKVINKLLKIKGMGLSKATKVLHTLYPEIIPMIDNQLQKEYCEEISKQWTEKQSDQILIDYYNNFKKGDNWRNLTEISNKIRSNNIVGLTKVRIFDILWWSYLKAKKLSQKDINWSTIKWEHT